MCVCGGLSHQTNTYAPGRLYKRSDRGDSMVSVSPLLAKNNGPHVRYRHVPLFSELGYGFLGVVQSASLV